MPFSLFLLMGQLRPVHTVAGLMGSSQAHRKLGTAGKAPGMAQVAVTAKGELNRSCFQSEAADRHRNRSWR